MITDEMAQYFEKRTREHIKGVKRNISLLLGTTAFEFPFGEEELILRGNVHDLSKFSEPERTPYIWVTEYYRQRVFAGNKSYEYPSKDIAEEVERAISHHKSVNRHHPEFFSSFSLSTKDDKEEMSDLDIAEMVCDWAAISQEVDQNRFATPRGYFEGIAKEKYRFSEETAGKAERYVSLLEHALALDQAKAKQEEGKVE